jgi:hypothetical protein
MEEKVKSIRYLHSFGPYLPNAHRLYILKSEVLSISEYVLPLFGHFLKLSKNKKELVELKKNMNHTIKMAQRWAGNTDRKTDLSEHLTNISNIDVTIEDRIASLNKRLLSLHKDHPLSKVKTLENSIPEDMKKQSLIFRTFESTLYHEYVKEKEINPSMKLSFKNYLKVKRNQKIISNSKLACYTMMPRKNTTSKTDIVYRIQKKSTRIKALHWRQNLVGYIDPDNSSQEKRKVKECFCKNCNVKFNRKQGGG